MSAGGEACANRRVRRLAAVRACALLTFIILVVLRLPPVAEHGRFWAEEGRLYFHNAWDLPWWQVVFRPENGYLSLYANVSALLARYCVPLEDAPRLTTGSALLAQCLPMLLLVSARDRWLRPAPVIFAAVLIVAMPPLCDEVWLNTANSQFHIALAAALCLALGAPAGWPGRLRCMLLFLAPLCGPISIALAPLFVFRAVLERQRARSWQAACFLAGVAPQLIVMASAPLHERGKLVGPTILACIFAAKHLAVPFLGEDLADDMIPSWSATIRTGHVPFAPVAAVMIVGAAIVWAAVQSRRHGTLFLLGSGLALSILSYNGAIGGGINLITADGNQRYAFAPSMLFALTATSLCTATSRWVAHGARIVVAWLLIVSVWQTLRPQDDIYVEGPVWQQEVARWREDPTYAPRIWPPGWMVRL